MEIVSPSDKPSVLAAKIADYQAVDVQEAWVVRAGNQTVEVRRLSVEEAETVGTYGLGQTILSRAFPDLRVSVMTSFSRLDGRKTKRNKSDGSIYEIDRHRGPIRPGERGHGSDHSEAVLEAD